MHNNDTNTHKNNGIGLYSHSEIKNVWCHIFKMPQVTFPDPVSGQSGCRHI